MEKTKTPPPLPSRSETTIKINPKDYDYSYLIENDIKLNNDDSIVFSVLDLSQNMDKFRSILNTYPTIELKFKDYESVKYIDSILKDKINNKAFLIDDAKRLDRSYIDLSKLKNINLTIPLTYLMWGVKFNESVNTYCFERINDISKYLYLYSLNGNEKVSYDDYVKLRKKIDELQKMNPKGTFEKVALVSDYLQSTTQFIEGKETDGANGVYITPDFPDESIYRAKSGKIETVLNDHNGLCMGISNLSTMLLNNDQMNEEVESVFGTSHVWNKVLIDGKYYYFDNTWNITRSDDASKDGLITLSFNKKYLFFGQNTASAIGNHNPETIFVYGGVISEDDMELLDYQSQFEYMEKPRYQSTKK